MVGSRQHYIPAWYLRNFTIEEDLDKENRSKRIYRYKLETGEIDLKKANKAFVRDSFLSKLIDYEIELVEDRLAKLIGKIYYYNPQLQARKITKENASITIPEFVNKTIEVKTLVDNFVSDMLDPVKFQDLCLFLNTFITRSPFYREELKISDW